MYNVELEGEKGIMMNWKGFGKKRPWPELKYYPSICLERKGLEARERGTIRNTVAFVRGGG